MRLCAGVGLDADAQPPAREQEAEAVAEAVAEAEQEEEAVAEQEEEAVAEEEGVLFMHTPCQCTMVCCMITSLFCNVPQASLFEMHAHV